ncbi:MAG: 4-hydroxythreonine-4-phosphate dehydrogenase PdxA [Acidobacteria bacterium]|nr:4-hydroxythreonine-4-phosphate dehydrogenase PdxA [Acidobacteriota bacterium]
MRRVRVGITVGDPAGIGPEIAARASADPRVAEVCEPVVFAPDRLDGIRVGFESAAGGRAAYEVILRAVEAARCGEVDAVATAPISKRAFALAGLPWKGHTELLAHLCGVEHVRMLFYAEACGEVAGTDGADGTVAGTEVPALQSTERRDFSPGGGAGQERRDLSPGGGTGTERRDLSPGGGAGPERRDLSPGGGAGPERRDFSPGDARLRRALCVTLATVHVPLADVPGLLTTSGVSRTITMTADWLKGLGVVAPRVALAGLNPHAGEGGLLGGEEEAVLAPAVAAAREAGVDASGPWPGDTVFRRATRGEFDAVVACYHDQGLIPVKLLAFGEAVNVTIGLPIIRTSVDHGTAFDIAGRGLADHGSLVAAVRLAARLAEARR